MRRLGPWSAITAVVATLAMAMLVAAPAIAHEADPTAEQRFLQLIADERAERGLRSLTWDASLAATARAHSEDMAREGRLHHNDDLGNEVRGWSALAENVGTGYGVGAIHAAFMDSAPHRGNILGAFTRIGVGVVDDDGALWVTQVFMTPEEPKRAQAAPRPRKVEAPKEKTRPRPRAQDVRAAGVRAVRDAKVEPVVATEASPPVVPGKDLELPDAFALVLRRLSEAYAGSIARTLRSGLLGGI